MSSQAIGQRFRVSRGGCWQCGSDCRSRLAEVLTFSQVAYNIRYTQEWVDVEQTDQGVWIPKTK